MKRAFSLLIIVAAVMMMGTAGPAAADPSLPGLPGLPGVPGLPGADADCAADVVIGSPTSGPANNIDGGPVTPRTGNPFGETPDTTIYEAYGYGGLVWPSIQSGCDFGDLTGDGVAHPGDSAAGTVANIGLTGIAMAVAFTGAVLRFAFTPGTLDLFDPVMTLAADALGDNVFMALFWVTLVATGVLIAFRANKARLPEALQGAGWVGLVGLVGLAATLWPLVVAPQIDQGLTSTIGAVNSAVTDGTGSTEVAASDGATANLHRALLYETWCAGMVGRGNGDTADEFCPRLFAASTFSREEWKEVRGDPEKASELADSKQEAFQEVAAELEEKDPAAFEYLNGDHNTDRIWYAALGWFGLLCAAPFVLMAGLLLIYALVVVRLGIMVAPAVAVVGGFPLLRHYALSVFDYVAGAIVTALVFGTVSGVFVAMIGAFMSPASGIHPLLSMILLGIATIAAWKLTKPIRRVKSLANIKERFGSRPVGDRTPYDPATDGEKAPSGSGGIFPPTTAPSAWAGTAPAEASMAGAALKGAVTGAAASIGASVVTGGTASVAGAAAGAAKGAGGAAVAEGLAARGATVKEAAEAPRPAAALPAGPASEPKPRVYTPGEAATEARVVEPTTEPSGEKVYPIYNPQESL